MRKPKIEADGEAEDMRHNLTNKERSIIIYSPLNFEFIWNSSRQIEVKKFNFFLTSIKHLIYYEDSCTCLTPDPAHLTVCNNMFF